MIARLVIFLVVDCLYKWSIEGTWTPCRDTCWMSDCNTCNIYVKWYRFFLFSANMKSSSTLLLCAVMVMTCFQVSLGNNCEAEAIKECVVQGYVMGFTLNTTLDDIGLHCTLDYVSIYQGVQNWYDKGQD